MKLSLEEIKERVKDSEKLIIALGEGCIRLDEEKLARLKSVIEEKDYFVLYSQELEQKAKVIFDNSRCTVACGEYDKQEAGVNVEVDEYMKWLTRTINRRLTILELEAGFLKPQLIRWPLETITGLNKKAVLIRVNSKFPMILAELADQACGIDTKLEDFIDALN